MNDVKTNKELYNDFLNEPNKGAVIEMHKWAFRIWFQNGKKVYIRKSKRYSHKALRLGDVETFIVKHIKEKNRYILEIVGKNNLLIPISERPKEQSEVKTGKTLIRDIPEGIHNTRIYVCDKKRTTLTISGDEYTISTPLLFKEFPPPIEKDIKITIKYSSRKTKNNEEYISGKILEWMLI